MTHIIKKQSRILLCAIYFFTLSAAAFAAPSQATSNTNSTLSENYLAGKDAKIGTHKNWSKDTQDKQLISIVHALVYKNICVFVTPTELQWASHIARKDLRGSHHLTDMVIDKAYLDALVKIIKEPVRQQQLTHWQHDKAAPVLTALLIPGSVDIKKIPQVTSASELSKLKVKWLIKKPYQNVKH